MLDWLNLTEATWRMLERGQTLLEYFTNVATIAGVAFLFVRRERVLDWLRHRLRRNRFPPVTIEPTDLVKRVRGIVFTLSRPEVPLWVIDTIKPSAVGFIVTSESRTNALPDLLKHCEAAHIKHRVSGDVEKSNPAHTRVETEQMINWLTATNSIRASKVAVDVTGGTVPMSLGAFMAAEERQVATLYTASDFDHRLKTIVPGSQRVLLVSVPTETARH